MPAEHNHDHPILLYNDAVVKDLQLSDDDTPLRLRWVPLAHLSIVAVSAECL